jgi:hypothetical protein
MLKYTLEATTSPAARAQTTTSKTFDLNAYILYIPVLPGVMPQNGDSKNEPRVIRRGRQPSTRNQS